MPLPCVAVAQAPTTAMWGSEARLATAKPCFRSCGQSWAYFTPAPTSTVPAARSTVDTVSNRSTAIIAPRVSAMVLKEWRPPSAFTFSCARTICCTSAIVPGRWSCVPE